MKHKLFEYFIWKLNDKQKAIADWKQIETMTMIHIIVAQQFNNKHKDAIIEIANLNKKKKTQVNQ